MPIEIIALLAAVGETVKFVRDSAQAISEIRSGFRANNAEAKRKAEEALAALQARLADVGQLARVVEEYARTDRDVLELLSLSRRAERVLADGLEDLDDQSSAAYTGNWRVVETLFDAIDSNGDVARLVSLDRAQWYSEKDKAQIEGSLRQYSSAYVEARTYVRTKSAREALHEARDMSSALQDSENLLRATSSEILTTLQGLQSVKQ